jgi:hypothetical protein
MSTDLSVLSASLPATQEADAMFNELASAGSFLPRLQLYGGNSGLCQQGKIKPGSFAIVKGESFNDLGSEVELLPLAWRFKALSINGDDIVEVLDPKDPRFNDIKAAAETEPTGNMYGIEFLMYIPATQEYVTYFMTGKSGRREAPTMRGQLHKATLVKSLFIQKGKFKWHAPQVQNSSSVFDVPAIPELQDRIEKFMAAVTAQQNQPKAPEETSRER